MEDFHAENFRNILNVGVQKIGDNFYSKMENTISSLAPFSIYKNDIRVGKFQNVWDGPWLVT